MAKGQKKDSRMSIYVCYFTLGVVFLYLGIGVAFYNASSFLYLHPLTLDWTSCMIVLYCCSIFFSNGCYGISLVWRELSLKFGHRSTQQKVRLVIASFFFILLSCIFQFAPLYLIFEDFNLQEQRRSEKKAFGKLCQEPQFTCEKRLQLVELFKKRRQLDVRWKALQKLRADYYLWDQIMENMPQLILLIIITNGRDFERNKMGGASLILTIFTWGWQRFLGYICTVEGSLSSKFISRLLLLFCFGPPFLFYYLALVQGLLAPSGYSAYSYINGLEKNSLTHNAVFFMDKFYIHQTCLLLAFLLHFGGIVWINSDLSWDQIFKEVFATILFIFPNKDWMKTQEETPRTTKEECLQDWLKFKRKLMYLTRIHIVKCFLVLFREIVCGIVQSFDPGRSHDMFTVFCMWIFVPNVIICAVCQQFAFLVFGRWFHPSSMLLPRLPDFGRPRSFKFFVMLIFKERYPTSSTQEEETRIEMQQISSTEIRPEANGSPDTSVVDFTREST
jgi:hypothetical protein